MARQQQGTQGGSRGPNGEGSGVSLHNMCKEYRQQRGEPPLVRAVCCSVLQQKGVRIGAHDM